MINPIINSPAYQQLVREHRNAKEEVFSTKIFGLAVLSGVFIYAALVAIALCACGKVMHMPVAWAVMEAPPCLVLPLLIYPSYLWMRSTKEAKRVQKQMDQMRQLPTISLAQDADDSKSNAAQKKECNTSK